jgi:transposase
LPDRSAESFARWLQGHPEVAIITRDRSGPYADGARRSAPFAAQITDRYHLVSNLAEAVERDVQQLQTQARAALAELRNASDSTKEAAKHGMRNIWQLWNCGGKDSLRVHKKAYRPKGAVR